MIKKYFACCLSLFSMATFAQDIQLVSNNPSNLVLKNTTPDYVSVQQSSGGNLYEDFGAVSKILMMEKDAPALPVFSESLVIPNAGGLALEVAYDSYVEIDNVSILPSKGSLKRNVNPSNIAVAFGAAYDQDAFFPGNLAQIGNPYVFRKTRGVTVTFYPYQYNPVTQKLRIYKNITANIIPNNTPGINERPSVSNNEENVFFNSLYSNLYANMPAYSPIEEEGEMLVITPVEYATILEPFTRWKIEEGIKTTVVTLEQTGSTAEEIKDYIADFYAAHPNLTYVQLVGDHQQLPCYTYGMPGSEELWSDSFYGQLDGVDFFPELMVGRFSGSVEQVQTMIDRTLEYEIDPHSGDWMTQAIGIGSNEGDGIGDDGEPDWQHLRNIGTKLMGFGYTNVHEFFDGTHGEGDLPGSPSSEMISTALNYGVGLLNYTGHGAQDIMVTGGYTSESVNVLMNDGKYPFVISVACNNGTFTDGTSLCESFMNVKNIDSPAGSIASCGSSILMAWAEPMQTQDEMTELITRSDSDNMKNTLGGLFYNGQISMLEAYDQSQTSEEVMQTWVFFGDPSVLFRSQLTTEISANHEDEIAQSGATLHISTNTNDARVSIVQDNTIIAIGQSAGNLAEIEIPELASLNPLSVTITKPNTVPYRGTVNVTTLGVSQFKSLFSIYPNPASGVIYLESTAGQIDATISIADMNGRILFAEKQVNLSSAHAIATNGFAAGVYLVSVQAGNQSEVRKIVIR